MYLFFSGFLFPNNLGLWGSEYNLSLFIAVDMCLKNTKLSSPSPVLTKLLGSISVLLD